MQQKLTLQVKLQQKLILTPSLQQAIKLLPMSTLELADMLQQEITENPLLEEELEQQRTEATTESANDSNDATSEGTTEAQAPDAKVDAEPEQGFNLARSPNGLVAHPASNRQNTLNHKYLQLEICMAAQELVRDSESLGGKVA